MLLTLSLSNINCNNSHCNSLSCPNYSHKLPPATTTTTATSSAVSVLSSTRQLLFPILAVSPSVANGSSSEKQHSLQNPNPIHYTCVDESDGGGDLVSSALAVASAIRKASTSPVEFEQRIDKVGKSKGGLVLPSPEFQRLCLEQLGLFRRIVHPDAHLSVFVRPAGSYVMDQLELRRVTVYPTDKSTDIVILLSNFRISTGLRATETSISNQHAEFIPECSAVVFPMVKPPFVVGFMVAELPKTELQESEGTCDFAPRWGTKPWEIQSFRENHLGTYKFTADQKLNAINITRSLAMAYVMDQKAMFLQQSSWQNNIRMGSLVEQIRGPLATIRTLSKMLSLHMKRSEISYDIVEDILVQGDHMTDTLQQLQDAVYLTKANIVRYNEETLTKMHSSSRGQPQSVRPHVSQSISTDNAKSYSATSTSKDLELPMPPLALAPLQKGVRRPCNISVVLADLVGAIEPLALKQRRIVELCELSPNLQVAVEEAALRQAMSNLIEGALLRKHVGGKVDIVSTEAPAGGALVIIDDDGPDMHYMTQMHSLAPFGADLFSKDMIEDNMTWNFVAGMTVAREILESYGCVVRVISPCRKDAALGAGGTRIELWFPSSSSDEPDLDGSAQEVV